MGSRGLVFFFLLSFLLAPAFAGTIPSGLVATINLTNFTFAADLEADTFSARDYGIAINDSYLDVNTTYFLTVNITNFTIDVYNFTANSTTNTANPTTFTAKMRNPSTRYNLKVNGAYTQEVLTDSYGNATWQYNSWTGTPLRFLLTTCLESWSYTQWSACSGGTQSRTGADANSCGTAYNVSEVLKSCSIATSSGGGGSGGGSFSEGAPSMKSLSFSFPGFLKILATVLYTLPEDQNITVSYPASISLFIPPIPGLAYSFIEITPTFNSSKYLSKAQIEFRVNKTWYSKNEIALGSTSLLRYDGKNWRSLPTVQMGEDASTYSFSANTTSFSLFAIAGTKRLAPTPTVTASPAATATTTPIVPTETETPTSTPVIQPPLSSGLSAWALPVILVSILAVILVFYLKKSRPCKPEPQVKPGTQVTIKGIVTSHGFNDFDVFDGTGFVSVKYEKEFPPLASRVEVKGTLHPSGSQTYIAAILVKKLL